MSHRFMTLKAPAAGNYYPDQSSSVTATSAFTSTTSGDSDFADGDSDALIYAINITGLLSHTYRIIDASGEDLLITSTGPGTATSVDFGPKGVRVSGGFLVICSTASATALTVIYDKVLSL